MWNMERRFGEAWRGDFGEERRFFCATSVTCYISPLPSVLQYGVRNTCQPQENQAAARGQLLLHPPPATVRIAIILAEA